MTRTLLSVLAALSLATPGRAGCYARLEVVLDLPGLTGNPFDPQENDVQVTLRGPDGAAHALPAFYDGGTTWRARHTPDAAGRWQVAGVTRNGQPLAPARCEPREFTVTGAPGPGFVRLAPDGRGFVCDDGSPYFPLGCNVGWGNKQTDAPTYLDRLGQAGINWSRVWMTHFDNRNLDWAVGAKLAPGQLNLEAIHRWDAIIETAERYGISVQMVLQHHGQYSSNVNANWPQHPWNQANGGWLATADEFFTDPRAIALTQLRYRYIVARWGYSPSVLAWELFNEVQYVDAMQHHHEDTVAAWHRTMAEFLRRHDPYRHLVTTSSALDVPGLWTAVDYYQPHTYPPDPIAAIRGLDGAAWAKPIFYGECGPHDHLDADDGTGLHTLLWASLVSRHAGAAQYWTWDTVERNHLYDHFRQAAAFVRRFGLERWRDLTPIEPAVETPERGPLRLGPAGSWGEAKETEFTVPASGVVPALAKLPPFLHGEFHKALFPRLTLHVDYPAAGTFRVELANVARAGAHPVLTLDGTTVAEHDFAAANADHPAGLALEAPVPAGRHTLVLENTGRDWVVLSAFVLDPYAPRLAAIGKADATRAVAWLWNRSPQAGPATGTVTLPALTPGRYELTWWDPYAGQPVSTQTVTVDGPLRAAVPPVAKDLAVVLRPAG